MRYVALASDYDGTLARDAFVSKETISALKRLRQFGRKLILVTGRILADLESVFASADLFDCIVAENGAVLYTPSTREKQVLAPPPKPAFVDALRRRGLQPLAIGDAIVSTWRPNETIVLEVIRDLGLELDVIFNKGAVMVLPSGINKRSGLQAALDNFRISEHNVVGIGDAENDHAFLELCECSVAVANAHPAVKETADLTTKADHGAGVEELVGMILQKDFAAQCLRRHWIPIGRGAQKDVLVPAYGSNLLVSGASGSGKSTFIAGLLEVLIERRYQVCLIDPEGDYPVFPDTIPAGDEKHEPSIEHILQILEKPSSQVIVNLLGINVADRPAFFAKLLPRLQEMRLQTGRPHWIIVDEAHHMLSPESGPVPGELANEMNNLVLVTVHPDHIQPAALKKVDTMITVGRDPERVMEAFVKAAGVAGPPPVSTGAPPSEFLAWFPKTGDLHRLDIRYSRTERKRHMRNYAAGELGEDRSFF
ncbi:MAG TPA: HAD hydrolase family protein, partial [Bryobacteraceae bacterium]|nr:HAD hydrolase family protein [Bryobacteraceae bacterium]